MQHRPTLLLALIAALLTVPALAGPTVTSYNATLPLVIAPTPSSTTLLYVSGTMHIESLPSHWPNPDALIAFFGRAVTAGKQGTTGMRWSIGADIGWLNGEPRAGEVVRATEALGVKWDVHAHNSADRVKVANRISTLGGHPTGVASGLTTSEIDLLRTPQTGVGLTAWQATIVWGLVLQPNHGAASDYFATGMWRPLSAAAYNQHDPNANLIAVGGGDHLPTSIENLATTLAAIPNGAPASATLMVDPDTLVIHGTTSTIDTLEQWATSMSARSNVRWATIDESAAAWVAAGGISSLRAP